MLVRPVGADEPVSEPVTLPSAWNQLSGTDSASALRSLWRLSRSPKEALPLASERLQGLLAGTASQRIAQLIEDLDSAKFAVRERAARELELIADTAAPHLQRVLNGKPSLELSRRVERLLAGQSELEAHNPRRLQAARAIALLETMATAEARAVLTKVARDGGEAWLAKEAEAALERLASQAPAPAEERLWEELADSNVGTASRAFLVLAAKSDDGRASAAEIAKAVRLVAQVPPLGLRSRGQPTNQLPHELLPYRKDVLAGYQDDGNDSPFRLAVRDALKVLQDNETRDLPIQEEFLAVAQADLNQVKRQIETIQKEKIGEAVFYVLKAAEELEAHKGRRAGESKLWQANYDYVLARLYARAACILEYSLMLGQIRRDNLPTLDPERHKGWRLVTGAGDVSDKDVHELGLKAQKLLRSLAEQHRQTPWEVIGRHEANTSFRLRWVPLKK
jgi:hypothetical protein